MTNLYNPNNKKIPLKEFIKLTHEIYEVLTKIVNNSYLNLEKEKMYQSGNFDHYISEVNSFINMLVSNFIKFYEEKPDRLMVELRGKTFYRCLDEFYEKARLILITDSEERKVGLVELYKDVMQIQNLFYMYENTIRQEEDTARLVQKLKSKLLEADHKLENLDAARSALEGKETEEIYFDASLKYLESARVYEYLFYMLLGGAVIITLICFKFFPYDEADIVNFILYKILIISIVVTLGSIFLRKASHLRKLHDQSLQTSLELQALPLFIKSLDKSDQDEIRKELTRKYFGKGLNQTQIDRVGDLIQDQVKSSVELVKASAEMVKSIKTIDEVGKGKKLENEEQSFKDKS
ncbi:hypothetical protein [Acinetobacter pragensis]|uniref:hypothetical protein n=1 Tax=Acinetobacter pragensis TaxID=1806892 RepID=UPI0033414D37